MSEPTTITLQQVDELLGDLRVALWGIGPETWPRIVEERVRKVLARSFARAEELERYDRAAVEHARAEVRKWKAVVWAMVDANTRNGEPTRIGPVALAAYGDVVTGDLLLFTKTAEPEP
jgi:hypothetical protein